jgi:SAM-dependent methyltransferase
MPDMYGTVEFWDEYYVDDRPEPYDWFFPCSFIAPLLRRILRPEEEHLMVGCGNAPFSAELHELGFTRQINIDNCESVIEQQRSRYPHLQWDVGDVRSMVYETDRFDVVFDKGLLDNLYCYIDPDRNCFAAMMDMYRVLRPGGLFVVLSCHDHIEVRGSMTADPAWKWDQIHVMHVRNPRFPPHGNVRVAAYTMMVARKSMGVHAATAASPDNHLPFDILQLVSIVSDIDGERLLLSDDEVEEMNQRVIELSTASRLHLQQQQQQQQQQQHQQQQQQSLPPPPPLSPRPPPPAAPIPPPLPPPNGSLADQLLSRRASLRSVQVASQARQASITQDGDDE